MNENYNTLFVSRKGSDDRYLASSATFLVPEENPVLFVE